LTLFLNEPILTAKGGYGHDQTKPGLARARDLDAPRLGLRRTPLTPVVCAWRALLVRGCSLALTGNLDWSGLHGEKAVHATALGAAGFVLWGLGARTELERAACWITLACALFALGMFPFASRLGFYSAVWLIHCGLCLQLAAWLVAARKAQRWGLFIILGGMLIETVGILPLAQLQEVSAVCAALSGMRLTCVAGSATEAMALPAAITLLLALWLTLIERALKR
jgi:hypothetical protein